MSPEFIAMIVVRAECVCVIKRESEGGSMFEKRNNARNENFEPFGRPTSCEGTLNDLLTKTLSPILMSSVRCPFELKFQGSCE